MQRKFTFALALLLAVGAGLWGVNYRLNNPPLTQADKEFRALVAGADSVEITQGTSLYRPNARAISRKMLDTARTQNFVEHLRFVDMDETTSLATSPMRKHNILFTFSRRKYKLIQFSLEHEEGQSFVCAHAGYNPSGKNFPLNYKLDPRFNKWLNRTLDGYLPQRIRP